MDVDGTLTDDGVYIGAGGQEFKRFCLQDGYGLVQLMRRGIKVMFISGRYSPATQARAEGLKISACVNGTRDKLTELKAAAEKWGIAREETAYAGDDILDIECIKWAGLGIATDNARVSVKDAADWVSPSSGGHGAVRDCVDHILEMNGENFD